MNCACRQEAPSRLSESRAPGPERSRDLLTPDGEHIEVPLGKVRSVFFVREFSDDFEPERKAFSAGPSSMACGYAFATTTAKRSKASFPTTCFPCLITGLQITHPDLNSTTDRIFVPRAALSEVTVLGVVESPAASPRRLQPPPLNLACSTNNPDRLYFPLGPVRDSQPEPNALRSRVMKLSEVAQKLGLPPGTPVRR